MELTSRDLDLGVYRKEGCGRCSLVKLLFLLVIIALANAIAACVAAAVVAQQKERSQIPKSPDRKRQVSYDHMVMDNGLYLEPVSKYRSTMELTSRDSDLGVYRKEGCGRCSLVKLLFLLVIIALATAIAACVAAAVVAQQKASDSSDPISDTTTTPPSIPEDNSVCVTPGCVAAAARVHENMNFSVHPCDNFFEYACGGWIRKHPIPEDLSSYDAFGILRDDVEVTLKALLEAPPTENELPPVTKAKNMYMSCMNESLIEDLDLGPLQAVFDELTNWPLLNSTWDGTEFSLVDLLIETRKHGYRPLIEQSVSTDLIDSSARIILLDQPSLIMPGRDYYNVSKTKDAIPALIEYIKDLAEAFGGNSSQVAKDVQDMVEFETGIAELTMPSEDRRDTTMLYNRMTIKDLTTNVSDQTSAEMLSDAGESSDLHLWMENRETFPWETYLNGIMNSTEVGIPVAEDEPVLVYAPDYLTRLMDYLDTKDNRTKANYIIGYVIVNLVHALPQEFRDYESAYRKVLYGTQSARARWRICAGAARDNLGEAVGRMFVDAEFDEDAKKIASEMIKEIRGAFNVLLEDLDWMDDDTRKVAKEKAAFIGENIGYSDSGVKNDTNLNQTYANVDYLPDEYLRNILHAGIWRSTRSLRLLREPVDKDEWGTSPAVVNAYYSSTKNHITFPAAILQPPFFSKEFPKSLNFGGIGLVIGHEITHGFDDRGRQFDKNGDLKEWWTNEVIERFKKKAQCIVDQYSEYSVPEAGRKLNGVNTQGENIADNGGLRQSYTAYRKWAEEQGKEEPKLPGLDLNHNQLFFINFAQIWCGTMRRENAIERILTGVHSPGRFRVIGSLHNSKEFSDVFNCASTSDMNPPSKCRVW